MIELLPLHPGEQSALEMARRAVDFIGAARRSLDLALYDVRLPGEPGDLVSDALRDAAARGVAVRIAYNADHDERVFPPPPRTKPELVEALPFPTRGIPGIPDLMHHKYVVRDGEAVWTGSTNWTTDSWTLQENVIVLASAPALAAEYTQNFEELWSSGDVDRSGHEEPRTIDLDGRQTRAWFTPGHGEELSHRIARAIGRPGAGQDRLPGDTSGARTAARPGRSRSSAPCSSTPTSAASPQRATRPRRRTTSCTPR